MAQTLQSAQLTRRITAKPGDKYIDRSDTPYQKRARTVAFDSGTCRIYLVDAEYSPTPATTAQVPHPRPVGIPGSFSIIVVARK